MWLDQHKTFLRYDVSSELPTTLEADPVLAFVSQMLSLKSDGNSSAELIAAAETFEQKKDAFLLSKNASV